MRAFILKKAAQFDHHFRNLEKLHHMVKDRPSFYERMNDALQFSRPELIAYAFHKAILDRDEATGLLKVQYQSIIDLGGRIGTDLKMAVTYLGYKAFHEKCE